MTPEEKQAKLARLREKFKTHEIVLAETTKIKELRPYVRIVLEKLGFAGALVTDESMVGDFFTRKELKAADFSLFEFPVSKKDYIWKVAEQLKELEHGTEQV